jgi:protoheme ferro-lyase
LRKRDGHENGDLLLNFGEPEHATLEEVVPFLERIFNLNVASRKARRRRRGRAPGGWPKRARPG